MNKYQLIATILMLISLIGFWTIRKEIIRGIKN